MSRLAYPSLNRLATHNDSQLCHGLLISITNCLGSQLSLHTIKFLETATFTTDIN
jgi:hypothetical protein